MQKLTFTFFKYIAYIAIYQKVITQFQSILFQTEKLSYSPFQCD